ncbi:trehalase family glycosidase [Limibacter armeniacum]|uniref:MGH1-like glycoside hydrolase domain-containing protein n=1 Tax=Limibacter armeniacum TaxID=466084 RepID=UPI002FE67028
MKALGGMSLATLIPFHDLIARQGDSKFEKNSLYEKTLEIAQQLVDESPADDILLRPRMGTGGGFKDLFLWDTAFIILWAKYHPDIFPINNTLDNFYRLQDEDGFIGRHYLQSGQSYFPKNHPSSFAPPLLSWAELEYFKMTQNKQRLSKVYSNLKAHHHFNTHQFKMDDNLFIGDPLGSGMDNLPRWPKGWRGGQGGLELQANSFPNQVEAEHVKKYCKNYKLRWNQQGRYIDMSAQMAFNALCLKEIAQIVGQTADIPIYEEQHRQIKEAINEKCWSEKSNFYFDLGFDKQVPRFHIGAYWTLIAGVVPEERLKPFISHLKDPKKFYRKVPVPTLAADEKGYSRKGDYWKGSVWAPTNYMVFHGLRKVGEEELAKHLAEKYYQAVTYIFNQTGTLWENYMPDKLKQGSRSQPDFCGWTGLASVAIFREFLMD